MRDIFAFAKNKIFLLIFFAFYFCFHILTGCQKSPSSPVSRIDSTVIAPVSDTFAKYSFIPDQYICAQQALYGGTEVGRPLTNDNFCVLYVYVSKKGYWSYPETTLNGMTYSGSGNFADTGSNLIKIYGSGTPIDTGTFDFPLNINSIKCFFRIIAWPRGTFPPADSSTALYYRAQIGTHLYYQDATGTNGFTAGSSVNGTDDVSFSADISPDNPAYPPGNTSFAITKGIMHNYLSSSNSQFVSFFNPKDYNFTTGPAYDPFSNGNGFTIEWRDSSGHFWNTYSGTGDQTGSVITVVSVAEVPNQINYYIRVKIRFSCVLYREDTGEGMRLTNGEFDGIFGKF